MPSADHRTHWKQKFRFIYRMLAWIRFRLSPETIHESEFGERYIINPHSYVERTIKEGIFETKRAAYLRQVLGPADVFIDIGANIGFFTMIAAPKGASVHAFEPDPNNYQRLVHNAQLNGFNDSQVKMYPCALGDESGEVVLRRPLNDNYGMSSIVLDFATDGVRVPLKRLDDVLSPPACRCVIKVDVEGAELQVLDGAKSFLEKMAPGSLWLVEVHAEDGIDVNAVAERFLQAGWRVSYFNDATGTITPDVHTTGDILLLATRP